MWGLGYQALRWFFGGTAGLNKNEKDQPPPLEEQRAHALKELYRIDSAIRKRRELQLADQIKNPPSAD